MRYIKFIIYSLILLFLAQNCKNPEKAGRNIKQDETASWKPPVGLLHLPINSPAKNVTTPKDYKVFQSVNDRYKENGAVIESLEGGKRERLWFASSRPDTTYLKPKMTNHFQQLYYTERSVDGGKCMNAGWGDVYKFEIENDLTLPDQFVKLFNKATKGSPSIAGNTMIIACDNIYEDDPGNAFSGDNKDLWQLTKTGEKWGNPMRLTSLSNSNSWDSQPALSPDGKHLFFVSDRFVSDNGKTINADRSGPQKHIFYSFFDGKDWKTPVLVKELATSKGTENITPSVDPESDVFYFSSGSAGGKYKIFEVPLELLSNGGYKLKTEEISPFKTPLLNECDGVSQIILFNQSAHAEYPSVYRNKLNKTVPQAFLWSSDDPAGYGGFDIYISKMPLRIEYNVLLAEKSDLKEPGTIIYPVLSMMGADNKTENSERAKFTLYAGLKYQIKGGSNATPENTTYCKLDDKYLFVGYARLKRNVPVSDRNAYSTIIKGAEVNSVLTDRFSNIFITNLIQDTVVFDTVYITKAWTKKPPCPTITYILPKHDSVSYFQTGFWEVNTSVNLKRDLDLLHEGYEVSGSKDIYNPTAQGIKIFKSDYRVPGENPMFPIKTDDTRKYSIADARWIELHPNNSYWGDHTGYKSNLTSRMKGRKERIEQYVDYARKVDDNLDALTNRIKTEYFGLMSKHMDNKPKLLIEIFAVSDQREVSRGWYIGETIAYRGSSPLSNNRFSTEYVKIVPPKVDETKKSVLEILPCSIGFNAQGNNGTRLGINRIQTETNTNLSKLRAWFGYKEVYNRLITNEFFSNSIKQGKVALPDNNLDYDKAEIIIVTQGRRIQVINPGKKYPDANNPGGDGYFDYDQVRRIEIRISLMYPDDKQVLKSYCCDPNPGK